MDHKPKHIDARRNPSLHFSTPRRRLTTFALCLWLVIACSSLPAPDCNHSGIEDSIEVQLGFAPDCNKNGIPDSCDAGEFVSAFVLPSQFRLVGNHTIADINGDQLADVMAVSNDVITPYLNDGSGEFFRATSMTVSNLQGSPLQYAHFNFDDRIDLLVLLGDFFDEFTVLLNQKDGSFLETGPFFFGAKLSGDNVVGTVDFDDDGDVDVVAGSDSESSVFLHENDGGGNFTLAATLDLGQSLDFVALDFDGNGREDLAIGNEVGVNLFRATGPATFETPPILLQPTGFPTDILAEDLDRDGLVDVVSANQEFVSVFLNLGANGDFAAEAAHRITGSRRFSGTPRGIAVGDLDGDGFPEIVSPDRDERRITVLENRGDGTFRRRLSYTFLFEPFRVSVADLDLDADADIFVTGIDGSFQFYTVLHSDREGLLDAPAQYSVGERPGSIVTADLDGDGLTDVAVSERRDSLTDTISVLTSTGNGRLERTATLDTGGETPVQLAAGDLNRDERCDLITANLNSDDLSVLLNTGNGNFASATLVELERDSEPRSVLITDIDGDLIPDLVVSLGGLQRVSILRNSGAAEFMEVGTIDVPETPITVAAAHMNADDLVDLAVGQTGTISTFLNQGGGDFEFVDEEAVLGDSRGLLAAHLDGDEEIDLLAAAFNGFSLLYGEGNGNFQRPFEGDLEGLVGAVAVADFDEDGILDIAATEAADKVAVVRNRGNRTFIQKANLPSGHGPDALALADLDGDEDLEVIVANFDSMAITVIQGTKIVGTDCNHDGTPDDCQVVESDCNENGVVDGCDISSGTSQDCDSNDLPDSCDIAAGTVDDCNENEIPDECDIAADAGLDCNLNGIPDSCDITSGASGDCNGNSVPDGCEIASGATPDTDENGIPDECELAPFLRGDCDGNGALPGAVNDAITNFQHCFVGRAISCRVACDADGDGNPCSGVNDGLRILIFIFRGGVPLPPPFPDCGISVRTADRDLGCEKSGCS